MHTHYVGRSAPSVAVRRGHTTRAGRGAHRTAAAAQRSTMQSAIQLGTPPEAARFRGAGVGQGKVGDVDAGAPHIELVKIVRAPREWPDVAHHRAVRQVDECEGRTRRQRTEPQPAIERDVREPQLGAKNSMSACLHRVMLNVHSREHASIARASRRLNNCAG